MRPRTEVGLAVAGLVVLAFLAGQAGKRQNRAPPPDIRRSSYLAGPEGVRAFATALERLGVDVERTRSRPARLNTVLGGGEAPLLVILDPARALDLTEGAILLDFTRETGDLLLGGPSAGAAMACFGYAVEVRGLDSIPLYEPGRSPAPAGWGRDMLLSRRTDSVAVDSSARAAGLDARCIAPPVERVDTLLLTGGGRPVVLRLSVDSGLTEVTLVADAGLFSNRRLQAGGGLGPLLLRLADRPRVVFDEFHQGFSAGGSLAGAVLAWSGRSPLGWFGWQLAVTGLLAMLAAAVRFGPVWQVLQRRRRSPVEHVQALATALASAHGGGVAVDLMVQGLRRRLSATGHVQRGSAREWLDTIAQHVRSRTAQDAVVTLRTLMQAPPAPDGVLRAAHAVEGLTPPSGNSRAP
jgi:hypothetical protein